MVEFIETVPPISIERESGIIMVDLSRPCKIPVIGVDRDGNQKEYFLKVTERKGLVLV